MKKLLTALFLLAFVTSVYSAGPPPFAVPAPSDATKIQGREIDSTAPTDTYVLTWDAATSTWKPAAAPGAGTGAPTDGEYVTFGSNGTLSAERVLTEGTGIDLSTAVANQFGIAVNTTEIGTTTWGSGGANYVWTFNTTGTDTTLTVSDSSFNVTAGTLKQGGTKVVLGTTTPTDNTIPRWDGTGGQQLQNSSVAIDDSNNVTGVAALTTSGAINKVTITPPATGSTLTIVDGGSLVTAGAYSITLTATGATNVTLPTSGTLATTAATQPVDATLTALAGIATADVSIIEMTGSDAFGKVTSGGNNYILGSNSDNSALEFKTPANVLSQIGAQGANANLAAIAGLTLADVSIIEGTGAGAANVVTATAGNQVLTSNAGNTALAFTGEPVFVGITLTGANTSPDATGEVRYDSTITGVTRGAIAWFDGTGVRQLVDLDTTPSNDGYVVAYSAGDGKFYMKQDADSGGATAWSSIGDAAGDGSVDFVETKQTLTSQLNSAGGVLTLANTVADLTADVSLLDLKLTDDGDANGFFIRAYDNSGADLKFSVGADGATTVGALTVTSITNNMSVFAATTSAQLYGVLSDETGSASGSPVAVFSVNPSLAGVTLTGDITSTAGAYDWDLIDNNASALSFDAAGKAGILEVVTTDSNEGVKLSGFLALGADPADATTAANILMSNATSILFEASAAGTDVNALSVDSSEAVLIGSAGASAVTITPATTITGALTMTANPRIYDGDSHHLTIDVANLSGDATVVLGGNTNTLSVANGTSALTMTKSLTVQTGDVTLTGNAAGSSVTLPASGTLLANALTSANIFVGNGSNVATGVAMSGDVTIDNTGATAIGADKVKDTMVDWGTGAGQVSLDDVPDSSSYQKIAAADVDASGHVNTVYDSDGTGAITVTGLTAARAITLADADQTLANLGSAQTFSGAKTFSSPILLNYGETGAGQVTFYEDSNNGSNYMTLKGPASLAGDTITFVLPSTNGTNGYVLTTDGSGNTSWTSTAAGDVTSVGNCTGGDCLDGSSDGGTQILLYDAQGATTLVVGDNAGAVTLTLPTTTGTLMATANSHGGLLFGDSSPDTEGEIGYASNNLSFHDGTASRTVAALEKAQTFTANNVFGDADTDTLTLRSLLVGGNSRAVWIAGSAPTPTYATGTNELYVAGDVESGGNVYAANFVSTGTGESYIGMANNASRSPTASAYEIYFEGASDLKFNVNGAEKTAARLEDAQTFTGAKTFSDALTLNRGATGAGQLIIAEDSDDGTNTVTITAQAMAASYTLTLPTTDGDSGQFLQTNGSGSLTWAAPTAAAAGSDTQVQFNDGGSALGGDAGFVFAKTTGTLTIGKNTVGGEVILYNELGATDYNATIQPNAAQAAAATITLPAATGTLIAEGLATGGIVLGDSTPDADGEIGYASNAYKLFANSEDLVLTASANLWTFSSATSATVAFTPSVALNGGASLGGTLALGANSITMSGSIGVTGTRVTKGWFTDVESTNMPTVGGTAILTSLTAPQFTTIELGAASDTTLSRVSAGVIAVEGTTIATVGANTFTGLQTIDATAGIKVGSTGVLITSDNDGAITFLGSSGGYDEDLTINLDDTENTAVFSSSTGVTKLDFSALNLATTGIITGAMNTNSDANGMSAAEMTTAGMYGTMFWATGAGTWALPGAATGMNFCVYSTTAAAIVINPDDGDTIVLNGTALSAGDSITSASGAGDFICLLAKDANTWYTLGRSGAWTDTN